LAGIVSASETSAADVDVREQYGILRQLALSGDATYRYGIFTFADEHRSEIPDLYEDAFQFLVQSAQEGYVESEYLLGYITLQGESSKLSIEEGVELLSAASGKGHGRARFWLAEYYMSLWYGREFSAATGAPEGPKYSDEYFSRARTLYESLIREETDEPSLVLRAKLELSTLLLAHSMDDEAGWDLLFELADSGYPDAFERLEKFRTMLVKGVNEGFDEPKKYLPRLTDYLGQKTGSKEPEIVQVGNIEKLDPAAYREIRALAVNGDPYAKHNAFVYVLENPVELREFVPEALEFLRTAADAGIPIAQYNLGFLYRTGQWVDKDLEEALRWLEPPALSGDARAQLWSGITYLDKYYAADEGPEADQFYASGEQWLRKLLESEEDCAECLFAKTSLGRAVISRSMTDPEGWDLLKEAASAGHEGAVKTLWTMEEMLVDFEARGYEYAPALLADLRLFLKSLGDSN